MIISDNTHPVSGFLKRLPLLIRIPHKPYAYWLLFSGIPDKT